VYPLPGSVIDVATPISFSVRDNAALSFVAILVAFGAAPAETAFDGSLAGRYAALSTTTPLPPTRIDFSLRRAGGWLTAPRIRIQAIDAFGLETELAFEWVVRPLGTAPPPPQLGTKPGSLAITRPFRRDRQNDVATASPAAARRARIGQILGTRRQTATASGELLWDPTFGSQIHTLRHRSGAGVDELAALFVREALARWEPTIAATAVVRLPPDPLHRTTKTFRVYFTDLESGANDSIDVG
jgi:hypothetical protein